MQTLEKSREYLNLSFTIVERDEIPEKIERDLQEYLLWSSVKPKDFTVDSVEVSRYSDTSNYFVSGGGQITPPVVKSTVKPKWNVKVLVSKPLVIELQEREVEVQKREGLVIK